MSGIEPQTAPGGLSVTLSDRAADEVRKFIEAEQVPAE